jgi:hypothetical protein
MEKHGRITNKGHGLSIHFKTKTRIALQMTDGLKPVMYTIDQDGYMEIKDRTRTL